MIAKKSTKKKFVKVLLNVAPGGSYQLSVGDRVTLRWSYGGCKKSVVRRITEICADSSCGSGARASVDGGPKCPTCKRYEAPEITNVCASYFVPVKK